VDERSEVLARRKTGKKLWDGNASRFVITAACVDPAGHVNAGLAPAHASNSA
jgi:hypothetical protein